MRALKANPLLPRLPPLAAAETHSDPPHRRLSGIEPQQPDAPTTTASATDPTLPPRCRTRQRIRLWLRLHRLDLRLHAGQPLADDCERGRL